MKRKIKHGKFNEYNMKNKMWNENFLNKCRNFIITQPGI